MTELTVGAGVARGMFDYAVARGADRQALVARSGYDPDAFGLHDNRVPFAVYKAMVRASKTLCGDEAIALHFAEDVNLAEISIVGLLGYASATMIEAFAQLNRYNRLVVEVETEDGGDRFRHERRWGKEWLVDRRKNPNDFFEHTEGTFARMVCGTRAFGTTPFVQAVHVTHADPGYRAEYERILNAPVTFEADWNAMQIDPAWHNYRIQLQPRYVFGILSEHANALLRSLEQSKSVRGKVESLLMPILHTGEASIDRVARDMAMSRQTLFRRLKAEGVTFEAVLDALRHRLALHYLGSQKVSVNETAYLVGFSDPAAFSRAFRRWTGMSPSEARAARAAAG